MTFALAHDLDLPANATTQTFALLGRRGSGKSYAAGKLAELLLDGGAQVVVVDPVGVWYGLRLDARGNAAGIPIPVFGGQRGDIPLEATAGAVVAQLVAERGTSLVLDVSEFSGADQRRFVADFATELLTLKKRARTPVMLIFDEAQEFVPQYVRPDHARMVGAMEKLVKLGRNFGIGVTLMSQRPQAVHKDVLNQTEVLMVFQLTGPQERKVIEGWVNDHGFGRKEIEELPRLPPGTAFVWSPQWLGRFARVKIDRKRTFDASATPEAGQEVARAELAPIDLAQVRTAMAATIEDAKANDPKALHAEIARLRTQVAASDLGPLRRQLAEADAELVALRARPTLPDWLVPQVDRISTAVQELSVLTADAAGYRVSPGWQPAQAPPTPRNFPTDPDALRASRLQHPATPAPSGSARIGQSARPPATPLPRAPASHSPASDGDGAARMLRALAAAHPTPLTEQQVSVLAGMKRTGGTYRTYWGRLTGQGLVKKDGQFLRITAEGLRAAGPVDRPTSPAELLAVWSERFSGKARDLLELFATSGETMTKPDAIRRVGLDPAGGTARTYWGQLSGCGLLERTAGGFRAVESLRAR